MGNAMNCTKIGNRIVVIAGTPLAGKKTRRRELPVQRTSARRIVVIRDGELVGSRPGR
jgi:hypothetical protein